MPALSSSPIVAALIQSDADLEEVVATVGIAARRLGEFSG